MKKHILLLLILIIPFNVKGIEINSNNYIMYNLNTEQVILEQNADKQVYIASLTKIATAIVAIENIDDINDTIIIDEKALEGLKEANASVAGFTLGQKVTYEDLLYGLMLPSGGDAAQALAVNIAGSNEKFVDLMNDLVIKLDLQKTNFTNTTGLFNENHYSTVYETSIILKYALNNNTFKEIFTADKYLTSDKSLTFTNSYVSIMDRYDIQSDLIIGAKTGFISQAGYCLASIANFDDETFILVSTDADHETATPHHVMDAVNIYQDVSSNYDKVKIYAKNDVLYTLDTDHSTNNIYEIKATDDFYYYTNKDVDMSLFEYVYEGTKIIEPSTDKGIIGTISTVYNGIQINKVDIIYNESIPYSLTGFISCYYKEIAVSFIALTITLYFALKLRKLFK